MATVTNNLTIQYFVDGIDDLEIINPEFYSLIEDNLTIIDWSKEDELYDQEVDERYGVTVTFKNYNDLVSYTEAYLEVDLGPDFTENSLQRYLRDFIVK